MITNPEKSALRKTARERRAAVSDTVRARFEDHLHRCLSAFKHDFPEAHIWAGYSALKDEIDVFPLLSFCQKNDIALAMPLLLPSGDMVFQTIDENTAYAQSTFGFDEPVLDEGKIIKPELFLVPGIAFDVWGNRLGYGRGHYDKYFYNYGTDDMVRIGVTVEELLIHEEMPHDPHDVRMTHILTENRLLVCPK